MKIIKTSMLRLYLIKFSIRIAIFIATFVVYIQHKEWLVEFMMQPIGMGVTPIHVLWLIFMLMMLKHIFPVERLVTMALKKSEKKEYQEIQNYSELNLHRFVKDMNVKAWTVMLVWLLFNSIFGALYVFKIIDEADLLMLTVFYFLCDYICILLYCPFQSHIMKNKCCVNCRIYEWGHFMMFTPMLFIRNFFSWSLFFMACIVLIRWEIIYTKYPERFWYGSNQKLQCWNCQDKTCQIKKGLRRTVLNLWKKK